MTLFPGLYEQIVNHAVQSELEKIPDAKKQIAVIDTAEASKVLLQAFKAEYVSGGSMLYKCLFLFNKSD